MKHSNSQKNQNPLADREIRHFLHKVYVLFFSSFSLSFWVRDLRTLGTNNAYFSREKCWHLQSAKGFGLFLRFRRFHNQVDALLSLAESIRFISKPVQSCPIAYRHESVIVGMCFPIPNWERKSGSSCKLQWHRVENVKIVRTMVFREK